MTSPPGSSYSLRTKREGRPARNAPPVRATNHNGGTPMTLALFTRGLFALVAVLALVYAGTL